MEKENQNTMTDEQTNNGGDVNAETVQIHQGGARTVNASHVTLRQGGLQTATTDTLVIRQGGMMKAKTQRLEMTQSGAGLLQAQNAHLTASKTGAIIANGDVTMDQAGARILVSKGEVSMDQGGSVVTVANRVQMNNSGTVFLFAREVQGDVTTMFGRNESMLFGATAGLVVGAVIMLANMLRRARRGK